MKQASSQKRRFVAFVFVSIIISIAFFALAIGWAQRGGWIEFGVFLFATNICLLSLCIAIPHHSLARRIDRVEESISQLLSTSKESTGE